MSEAAALRQTGASPLRPGDPRRIGPYAPLALLGSGGMGRVFLARATDDGPGLVAVKVIRPEYADDPGFRRRFEREASVHAQVRTPHAPRLCGTGFQDELLWMATEYLPAVDLAEAVREGGALESAAVWRLVGALGRALADLGDAGIVHRDLKPSNVLLSARGTHVIDFGLSKAVDASALTGTGNRVGTPAYMSPEHLRTGTCTTASDVFSLAGTLVYAAQAHAPFGDGTGVDVMHRVAFEDPNPQLLGEISATDPELGSLLSACLAKEPETRPTPRELVDAAGARAGASAWPEPLKGQVAARQRAYEVLARLPVEVGLPPSTPEVEVGRGAAAGGAPSSDAAPQAERPAGARRAWGRRKPALTVAAGVTVCAVAAGVFVLTRQDSPAAASSPGVSVTAAVGDEPGGAVHSPGRERSASPGESTGSDTTVDGGMSRMEASGSPGVDRPATPSTSASAAAEPDVPTAVASSADASPSEASTPPWNSDCTYYAGKKRTSQGDSGKPVSQVQCMLTKRGYAVGGSDVDGEFGPGTESAVRAFQSDRGLDADGIVDRKTWTALRETT